MRIKNGWLYSNDGKMVRKRTSPNQAGSIIPSLVVYHDTVGNMRPFSTVDHIQKRSSGVSYHFVVERDGTITQCVPTDRAAWHAGPSKWGGRYQCNSFSVGVGIVNPGKLEKRGQYAMLIYRVKNKRGQIEEKIVETFPLEECEWRETPEHGAGYWLPYTDAQIASAVAIGRAVADAYEPCNEFVCHYHVSPGRKIDANPLFPLADVKRRALEPQEEDADDDDSLRPLARTPVLSEDAKRVATNAGTGAAVAGGGAAAVTEAVKPAPTAESVTQAAKATKESVGAVKDIKSVWPVGGVDPGIAILMAGALIGGVVWWVRR